MGTAGAIIGGLGVIGNVFGTMASASKQRAENEAAAKLNYEYGEKGAINAQKRDEEMYLKYQSPNAMVTQYKEAGLNPALMNGGQGATGGSIGHSSYGDAGAQKAGDVANIALSQQQERMQAVNAALGTSQVLLNLKKAKATDAETETILEQLGYNISTRETQKDILNELHKKGVSDARIRNVDAQIREFEKSLKAYELFGEDTYGKGSVNDVSGTGGVLLYENQKYSNVFQGAAVREIKSKKALADFERNMISTKEQILKEDARGRTLNNNEKEVLNTILNETKSIIIEIKKGEKTEQDLRLNLLKFADKTKELSLAMEILLGAGKTATTAKGLTK